MPHIRPLESMLQESPLAWSGLLVGDGNSRHMPSCISWEQPSKVWGASCRTPTIWQIHVMSLALRASLGIADPQGGRRQLAAARQGGPAGAGDHPGRGPHLLHHHQAGLAHASAAEQGPGWPTHLLLPGAGVCMFQNCLSTDGCQWVADLSLHAFTQPCTLLQKSSIAACFRTHVRHEVSAP